MEKVFALQRKTINAKFILNTVFLSAAVREMMLYGGKMKGFSRQSNINGKCQCHYTFLERKEMKKKKRFKSRCHLQQWSETTNRLEDYSLWGRTYLV